MEQKTAPLQLFVLLFLNSALSFVNTGTSVDMFFRANPKFQIKVRRNVTMNFGTISWSTSMQRWRRLHLIFTVTVYRSSILRTIKLIHNIEFNP